MTDAIDDLAAKPFTAKEKMVSSYRKMLRSFSTQWDTDQARTLIEQEERMIQASRQLLENLFLVVLVTQVEVFIGHLIDVILTAEPRRFKDLGSEKTITASELVDLGDHSATMKRMRSKVSREIINSSPKEMFIKHLGNRLGLFGEAEFIWVKPHRQGDEQWGFPQIEKIWTTRHAIVHEAGLAVNQEFLRMALAESQWLETFLSLRASKKYKLKLDSREVLEQHAKELGIA